MRFCKNNQSPLNYVSRAPKLLKDVDRCARRMAHELAARYGSEMAASLIQDVRREYEIIIP